MLNTEVNASMNIALVFVGISSIKEQFLPLIQLIESLINRLLDVDYDVRVASIESFSNDSSLQPIVHPFSKLSTADQNWSKHFTQNLHSSTNHQNLAICDALRAALDLEWISQNDSMCHENVVFLVTDSYPCQFLVDPHETGYHDGCCDCDDLWTISDRFVKQNLTLVVVGLGNLMEFCDSLYGAVARNTGGEYIPIVNASRILWLLSQSLILNGYTLSQSFRHIRTEEFERNSSYHHSSIQEDRQQAKHCQTSALRAFWLMNK